LIVFNLNIVDLILLLHHEKNHILYKKNYFNKKLFTIPLRTIHPTITTKLDKILSRIKLRLQYK
jgi:hypothetical protein